MVGSCGSEALCAGGDEHHLLESGAEVEGFEFCREVCDGSFDFKEALLLGEPKVGQVPSGFA